VLDRLDFILAIRVRGRPLIIGAAFLGVLVFSLLLFVLEGNGKVVRVLFFPAQAGRGMVAEERLLPRHRVLEQDVTELAEGVLLGPTRHDALRAFPRGASVLSSLVHGRTLYIDLSPRLLVDDPEVPLKGEDALTALARSIKFNFPRVRQIVFFIDGQAPHFPGKKNI
jgi:Sporulation and spore germination